MFSSLTEHVELTFKVSTFQFISPLPWGQGWGLMQYDKYNSSYSFYFALQSLPEISDDT